MHLELSHIRQAETEFSKVFDEADLAEADDDYRVTAPVDLRMVVQKDHDRFRLVGTVVTALELGCSRCLEPFALPIDRRFDLRYLPSTAHEAAGEKPEAEVEDDDVAITFYRDDRIDLRALVREQFYLALPMKPLCSEECRGLCSQCGTNLNAGTCDCAPVRDESPFAALEGLGRSREPS